MKRPNFFWKWKRWMHPYEWQRNLLGLSFSDVPKTRRGLVLIQIDGLSHPDLKRAMARKHMPFLSRLMKRENYHLWPLYSGIPSNTPAFQGELFFGQPQCVPAFQYRDCLSGDVRTMFEKNSAEKMEKHLLEKEEGLMAGGSAYGNIFSGGAAEAHICASTADWVHILKAWNPYSILVTFLLNPYAPLRTAALIVTETVLAIFDFLRGAVSGQDMIQELFFIVTRLFSSVLVRDIATAHAQMDIYRGLPVIHVNYFGYDEQAHRRGPSTRFAYWSLSGIDQAVKRLWKSALTAKRRHYDVWVYSDHGQEAVTPFSKLAGRSIREAAQEIYDQMYPGDRKPQEHFPSKKGEWGDTVISKPLPEEGPKTQDKAKLLVTTLGPIAQIYFPIFLKTEEKKQFSKNLLEKNSAIPLAVVPLDSGEAECRTKDGVFRLPEDKEKILGSDHPYCEAVVSDLPGLFSHENRGDIMLFGWAAGHQALSYSNENGAHAGLGPRETQAFALLPEDAPLAKKPDAETWIRAIDLRKAALVTIGKEKKSRAAREKLRVLSYNVHSCVGTDGILSVERTARVIAKADPDVVALQELDSGRKIRGENQAAAIARELEMSFHFHSVCGAEAQCFGNAILSRAVMKVIRSEHLPTLGKNFFLEPRGILGVEIDFQGRPVQIFNTHLSLWAPELRRQLKKLLGPELFGALRPQDRVILCGDLNLNQGSAVYKKIKNIFREPGLQKNSGVLSNTWPSQWPLRRLDHILVKGRLKGEMLVLPRTRLERFASDHLPIAADFELEEG